MSDAQLMACNIHLLYALRVEFRDIPEVDKHPPCPLSSKRMKKFRQQQTIAAMFAKKRGPPKEQDTEHTAKGEETECIQLPQIK